MQGDTSFTNLLNEGSYLDNESIGSSNLNVQIYEPQVEIESSVKKPLGGDFSIEEDILLVEVWINTTINPVQGNEQTWKTYWMRICENYNANKTFDTRRIPTSLTNRWSTIQKSVNNFCGCLAQIESVHQSRLTQQDKIARAKELYQELNKTPFSFEHCWNVLKTCPKWSSDKEKVRKRSFATASLTSILAPINIGENNISISNFVDLERPFSRKAAKKQLNKHDIIWGLLIEMNERANIVTERKLQLMERRNAQEEERIRVEERKVRLENDKIMLMDTSGLSEVQREYIRIRQLEILESRRKK